MKKRGPDLEGMMLQVQQQLTYLDKKIDALIEKGLPQARPQPPVPARPAHQPQSDSRPQRTMHKVVCADCRKECEVPFRPSGDRPVYCRDCFAKRKAGSQFKPHVQTKPGGGGHIHEGHGHKPHGVQEESHSCRKPGVKKTAAIKRKPAARKKR